MRKRVIVRFDNKGPLWLEVKFQDVVHRDWFSLMLFILKGWVSMQCYTIHNEISLQPLAPWCGLWVWKCRGYKEFSEGIFIAVWFCRLFQDKQSRGACNVTLSWQLLLSRQECETQGHKHAWIPFVNEWRGVNFFIQWCSIHFHFLPGD